MRNMSFSATKEQIEDHSKTVTRRTRWRNLKVGDRLQAVEKGMGLKKGEKVKKLAVIEVTDVRQEWLPEITQEDCAKEGFPELTPLQFVDKFNAINKGFDSIREKVTRIEFRYLSECPWCGSIHKCNRPEQYVYCSSSCQSEAFTSNNA